MGKRLFALVMCIVFLVMVMPGVALAAEGTDWSYENGKLTVFTNAGTTEWRSQGILPASVTDLVLMEGITQIGQRAFENTNITTVEIPNSVQTIGDDAFAATDVSGKLIIPDNVTTIGARAFGATKITKLVIGKAVRSIGIAAFGVSHELETIEFRSDENLKSIGDSAFWKCKLLTSVSIPNSVETIERSAFGDCTGLESVTIGKSVTSIGALAFAFCNELDTMIFRGDSAPTLEDYVFDHERVAPEDKHGPITVYYHSDATGYDATWLAKFPAGSSKNAASPITVTIDPVDTVVRGRETTFTAKVEGEINPKQDVLWSVTDNGSSATKITEGGVLSVGSDETANTLTIVATSKDDRSKSGTAVVKVITIPDVHVSHDYGEQYVAPAQKVYSFIEGKDLVCFTGSDGAKFVIDADYSKLRSVENDRNTVARDMYSSWVGSTVIMLKPEFLATLALGEHTLRVNFEDGYAETKFTISAPVVTVATEEIPQTGDSFAGDMFSGNGGALAGLVMLAGLAVALAFVYAKKRDAER